ncbi:MAG: glycosyltransferase family 1 protein [Bacteroidetes bacterium]|nr:MAG: glycosyltransferase family 1 protein [Bacteroidota bacterium]
MYKKVNYNFIHLPMPMWVAPQYRKISTLETNNVSFIGSKDIQRWMLFENLANNHKFEIQIMGSGWQDKSESKESIKIQNTRLQTIKNQFDFITKFGLSAYSRKLQQRNISLQNSNQLQKLIQQKPDFEKYIQVTKESMVTLGVNRYPSYLYPLEQASTYSRLRDIEAPMLGACYLTEYTEGLESLYDIGNEIEVYKNGNELIEKIKYLASNSSKRKDFRRNGQARALKNHAILNSLKAIFEKLWK